MNLKRVFFTLALLPALVCGGHLAEAQYSNPTAIQSMELSAFVGGSGVYTGLGGGRNLSFTAGADLSLPPYRRMRPVIEIRGTYPVKQGGVDGQKSILGGLRVDYPLGHRFHPYGDFLFGRGETNYRSAYLYNNFVYALTTNYVYSYGGGMDYDLTGGLAVKVDAQLQHWGAAPTASGTIYPKVGTLGVVYRFNFNGRRRR